MATQYQETAARLRSALDRAGLRAQDLANQSGIGKSSISQYLSGSHAPSNKSAGRMADVLGVNPVWLMGFDVPMTAPLIPGEFSDAEREIISAYRNADPGIQRSVRELLEIRH